jgi:hypothetical protein
VYKKRTALSNGPTRISPSPTFFHLKPKILFLKCCGIKKKTRRRRTISETPIRLTFDTLKIQGDLILCTKMVRNIICYFLLLPYLQCRFKMHIYRSAPGFKNALICITFMFLHFYIRMLRGSAIKNHHTINYYIQSVSPSLTAVAIMSKFNRFWVQNLAKKYLKLNSQVTENNAPTLHGPTG